MFNNLGLALGMAFKFSTSVEKELKLNVRKFWRLIPTFIEIAGENQYRGLFGHPVQNRVKFDDKKLIKMPNNGEYLKFRNYERKKKSPFTIYAV